MKKEEERKEKIERIQRIKKGNNVSLSFITNAIFFLSLSYFSLFSFILHTFIISCVKLSATRHVLPFNVLRSVDSSVTSQWLCCERREKQDKDDEMMKKIKNEMKKSKRRGLAITESGNRRKSMKLRSKRDKQWQL